MNSGISGRFCFSTVEVLMSGFIRTGLAVSHVTSVWCSNSLFPRQIIKSWFHCNCNILEVACCICHHCPDDGGNIETSVNFYEITWCNNPEDNHLNTCHHENLKAHCTVSNVFLATHRDQWVIQGHTDCIWQRVPNFYTLPCAHPQDFSLIYAPPPPRGKKTQNIIYRT
jgi:hypothetical protein